MNRGHLSHFFPVVRLSFRRSFRLSNATSLQIIQLVKFRKIVKRDQEEEGTT